MEYGAAVRVEISNSAGFFSIRLLFTHSFFFFQLFRLRFCCFLSSSAAIYLRSCSKGLWLNRAASGGLVRVIFLLFVIFANFITFFFRRISRAASLSITTLYNNHLHQSIFWRYFGVYFKQTTSQDWTQKEDQKHRMNAVIQK